MSRILCIDLRFNLIQHVRLAHAIAETDLPVSLPEEHAPKLERLRAVFGLEYRPARETDFRLGQHIRISHPEPITAVGDVVRPLILPHAMVRRCRELWAPRRALRYSFAGLVTPQREQIMREWIRRNITAAPVELPTRARRGVARRLWDRIRGDDTVRVSVGDLHFWSSTRGRRYPIKAWDEDYFRILGNSQFVLCPRGDYSWSYRFFESVLCGAVPIVEEECPPYEGFRFLTFEDEARKAVWSAADAEHNFALCLERLTVPHEELSREIDRILRTAGVSDRTGSGRINPGSPG